jgi:small subunit ribosomal protein S8
MSVTIHKLLSHINNGIQKQKKVIFFPYSSVSKNILQCLYKHSLIRGYKIIEYNDNKLIIVISLKYKDGISVLQKLITISKSSKRFYIKNNEINRKFLPNLNHAFYILSTSKGIYSHWDAKYLNIGGEVLLMAY